MAVVAAGKLLDRLILQTNTPETFNVASITRSSNTATVTTTKAHGYSTGNWITIAGAVESDYNITAQATVTSTTAFTYAVENTPSTPATGSITAVYDSDAQGGRTDVWREVDTVHAERLPLRGRERLEVNAIQAEVMYRFRVRLRDDLVARMRALWTPRWPPRATQKTLEIHSVQPFDDGRQWMMLDTGEIT